MSPIGYGLAGGRVGLGLAQGGGTVAVPWYRAGGAAAPLLAYQSKDAASYAASKSNLVTPGTHDAANGSAYPTWAAATGWTFNGSNQYLTVDVPGGANYSILIRYSTAVGADGVLAWSNNGFIVRLAASSGVAGFAANGGSITYTSHTAASGVIGIAGNQAYYNGATLGGTLPSGALGYGNFNIARASWDGWYLSGAIAALAVWASTLTGPQVAAVSAAMAAL